MTLTDEQTAKLTTLSDRLLQLTADGFRCETCKWWDGGLSDSGAEAPGEKWGSCQKMDSVPDGPVHHETKAYTRGLLITEWGEEDCGWVRTAPDFGCVQWERG